MISRVHHVCKAAPLAVVLGLMTVAGLGAGGAAPESRRPPMAVCRREFSSLEGVVIEEQQLSGGMCAISSRHVAGCAAHPRYARYATHPGDGSRRACGGWGAREAGQLADQRSSNSLHAQKSFQCRRRAVKPGNLTLLQRHDPAASTASTSRSTLRAWLISAVKSQICAKQSRGEGRLAQTALQRALGHCNTCHR